MPKVVMRSNIKQVLKELGAFERDIPFILKETANDIAFEAIRKIKAEVQGKLHIRKKYIPNAWRVRKAEKSRLYAELYVDDWSWQKRVLEHHYYGGDRQRKGIEKAMIHLGLIDKDEILTPPPGVKIRPSTYVQIMSQLKLFSKAGFVANETKRSRTRKKRQGKDKVRYFFVRKGNRQGLHPGVYARKEGSSHLKCILRVASRPHYKKRLDAESIVRKVIERRMRTTLAANVEKAWAFRRAKGW